MDGAVRVRYCGCASQYPATSEPFSDSVFTPFSACHGYCHGYPTGRVWAGSGEGLGEGSVDGAVRVRYCGCASQYPATSEPFSDSVFTPFSA